MSTASLDEDTANAVRAFISRLSGHYDVIGAILFGSRARQTHRPDSDADFAVLLHGQRGRFLDTKLALADIAYGVLLETGVLIQPLPVWEDEGSTRRATRTLPCSTLSAARGCACESA